MIMRFCPYCGKPLEDNRDCAEVTAEERREYIERIEEEQDKNGFYAFQDLLEMYRRER